MSEDRKGYIAVVNLQNSNVVVPHGADNNVRSILLRPAGTPGGTVTVERSTWRDAPGLSIATQRGLVRFYDVDHVVDPGPGLANVPEDAALADAMMAIVYGPRYRQVGSNRVDAVDDLITLEARDDTGGGAGRVDTRYMKERYLPMLENALRVLGEMERTTERRRRMSLLKKRIGQLKEL